MEIVLGLSYGVGLLFIGIAATIYWGNGSDTIALWAFIGGVIWLILTGGLQTQLVISKTEPGTPKPTATEMDQSRAYVSIIDGSVTHTPGSAPTVSLTLKNTGRTEAREVGWRVMFGAGPINADIKVDEKAVATKTTVPPDGNLSYQFTYENWGPEWEALLKSGKIALIAVGDITYRDIYGREWPSEYRYISGGAYGRSDGIGAGRWGPAPNTSEKN